MPYTISLSRVVHNQGLLHGMSGCQVRQEEAQVLASCRLHVLPQMNARGSDNTRLRMLGSLPQVRTPLYCLQVSVVLHAWFAQNDDDHTSSLSSVLHTDATLMIHPPSVTLS